MAWFPTAAKDRVLLKESTQFFRSGTPLEDEESPPQEGLQATHFLIADGNETGAVCLDGSPPHFYYWKGYGSGKDKWHIHHEGFNWCSDLEMCLERSYGWLGSSLYDHEQYKVRATMYFDRDRRRNPLLYNWNQVYMRHCDGGAFTGNREEPVSFRGQKMYFRGARVLTRIQEELFDMGLAEAREVVISGCSSGGMSAYFHLDQWADQLRSGCKREPKVVGLIDSGFFPDFEGSPGYESRLRWVYKHMQGWHAANPRCRAAFEREGEGWRCMFAEHLAPHIAAPLFHFGSQYDSWILANVYGVTDKKEANRAGHDLRARVQKTVGAQLRNGVFLDSCWHHSAFDSEFWSSSTGPNSTWPESEAFAEWYKNASVDGEKPSFTIQDVKFPCNSCCVGRSITNTSSED